ncbi:MAG: sigma-70 family RNA polymerase sigma factor [Phycisphaerae bacterium]|nr:sigma-70 family RNA polymerase sigma factor [Phycisphaerae bacterium]
MKNSTASEQRQKLASAGLTPKQALCLALHCFDGLTHEEVGLCLGIAQRTASYHIAAARRRLAEVGLRARVLRREFQPVLYPMDPSELDNLGLREIKGVW